MCKQAPHGSYTVFLSHDNLESKLQVKILRQVYAKTACKHMAEGEKPGSYHLAELVFARSVMVQVSCVEWKAHLAKKRVVPKTVLVPD